MSAVAASPLRGLRGSAWAAARLAARAGGASASGTASTASTATSTAYAVQQIAEMAQRRKMRAGQEADLSEHVKDRPQREGRRRSTPAAPPAASAPGGSDDPAAARRAAATLAAASAARCDVAVRVVALGGGEYAIKILLPPEVVRSRSLLTRQPGAVEAAAEIAAASKAEVAEAARLVAKVEAKKRV